MHLKYNFKCILLVGINLAVLFHSYAFKCTFIIKFIQMSHHYVIILSLLRNALIENLAASRSKLFPTQHIVLNRYGNFIKHGIQWLIFLVLNF